MTEKEGTSADLVALLNEAPGNFVSGEYLSQCLGITRAAVWKRIKALKKEGYLIDSSTKKGYRLNPSVHPYGKSAIQKSLATQTLGRRLDFYKTVTSTNLVLKQLAFEGAPEGTAVIADSQEAGRGRLGRSWMSEPELGIWMSVLLRPPLHPSEVQTLTLAASVAVCRALAQYNIAGIGIKWPNDILINRKKVCGILTELSAEAERVAWVILGIGINVNHEQQDFPDEIRPIATSLRLAAEKNDPLDRSLLAAGIINELEQVYDAFLHNGSTGIVDEWKRWNLILGKRVRLSSQQDSLVATAKDITHDGKLIVERDDGTILEVLSGEISLREVEL